MFFNAFFVSIREKSRMNVFIQLPDKRRLVVRGNLNRPGATFTFRPGYNIVYILSSFGKAKKPGKLPKKVVRAKILKETKKLLKKFNIKLTHKTLNQLLKKKGSISVGQLTKIVT